MSKNHRKSGQKFLQREFFFVRVLWRIFFCQGSEEMSKNMPAKFQGRAIFQSFLQKKVTQRWWTDILLPQSISLAALLIACSCYVFMACPRDLMANSAARSAKTWPPVTCHSCLSRLGVAPCTIGMSTSMSAGNPCFLRQKLLWRHFSRSLPMWFFSLLCWAHKRKNSVSFKAKSNLNPSSSHMWKNESIRRTGSYEKSSSNILLLVAVAL